MSFVRGSMDSIQEVVVVVVDTSVVDGSQWMQMLQATRRGAESACRLASSAD